MIVLKVIILRIIFLMILSGLYLYLGFSIENLLVKVLFFIVALWLFVWGYYHVKMQSEKIKKELEVEIEEILSVIPHAHAVLSNDYLTALLIDEQEEKVIFLSRKTIKESFEKNMFYFHELFEVAYIKNDRVLSIITKGEKNGIVLKKEGVHHEESIKKISVKFLVNNLTNPELEFVFFESETPILKGTDDYKKITDVCNDWFHKMTVIIKRTEHIPFKNGE